MDKVIIVCPCCGYKLEKGPKFCPECGSPLKDAAVAGEGSTADVPPGPVKVEGPALGLFRGLMTTDGGPQPEPQPQPDFPKGPDDSSLKMIVDYCRKTLATAVGDGHDETVLYLDEKTGQYQIHRYVMNPGEQGERHVGFSASSDAYDAVMKHIKKARLASYDGKRADALCGGEVVVKFLKDDKMIRISTSNVPYKHHSDLDEVGRILGSYIDKKKELH